MGQQGHTLSGKRRNSLLRIAVMGSAALVATQATAQSASYSQFGPNVIATPPAATSAMEGYRYSRTIRLQYQTGANAARNGEIIGTYQWLNTTDVEGRVTLFASKDGGRSFGSTPIAAVFDRTHPGYEFRSQPHLYELPVAIGNMPAGTVLLTALSRRVEETGKTYIQLYKSNDAGRSFTLVSDIAQGGVPRQDLDPIWEPFLLAVGTGSSAKLIAYYSDEREAGRSQKLVHQTSTDGINWGPVVDDVVDRPTGRPGMAVVSRMSNGQYILTYEHCGTYGCQTRYQLSDDPENWRKPSYFVGIPDGTRSASTPYNVFLPRGGRNGVVIVSGYKDDALYLNYEYAQPDTKWIRVQSPVRGAWSRSMTVMPGDKSILVGSTPTASGERLSRWTMGNQFYGDVPASVTTGEWYFTNKANGKRMAIADGAGSNAPLIEAPASDCACQKWRFVAADNGYHRLVNVQNGQTLEVQSGFVNEDRVVQTGTSVNAQYQHWRIIDRGTGFVQVFNRNSGKTFSNFGATTAAPALRQAKDAGLDRQYWTLTKAP